MANHYKKIREAKAVVDCSSPKGYNKNACNSNYVNNMSWSRRSSCGSRQPRSCSPSARSSAGCPLEYHQRCYSAPTCKMPDLKEWVINPCKFNKKNDITVSTQTSGQNSDKVRSHCSKQPSKGLVKEKPKQQKEEEQKCECIETKPIKQNEVTKPIKQNEVTKPTKQKEVTKPTKQKEETKHQKEPIKPQKFATTQRQQKETKQPTTATKQQKQAMQPCNECTPCKTNDPQESEYVHFLLKITEDILRNNLYTDKEMEKLFESHIKANKNRLNEKRMHDQIEELKKELNLPLRPRDACESIEPELQLSKPNISPEPETLVKNTHSNSLVNEELKMPLTPLIEDEENEDKIEMPVTLMPVPEMPVTDMPVTEMPVTEMPVTEMPVTEMPVAEMPVAEVPVTEMPVTEMPIDNDRCNLVLCNDPCDNTCLPTPAEQKDANVTETGDIPKELENQSKHTVNQSPELSTQSVKKINIMPNPEEISALESGEQNCKDPVNCLEGKFNQNINISRTTAVKIKNTNSDKSLIMPYTTPDSEEPCYCSAVLQRTALKIQTGDENEEYILVDGPVCMPRSMLENKTIPVLVQNVSSMVLNDGENAGDQFFGVASGVNLFQQSSDREYCLKQNQITSVSAMFATENAERDYDITPQREDKEDAITENQLPETRSEEIFSSSSGDMQNNKLSKNCKSESCPKNKSEERNRSNKTKENVTEHINSKQLLETSGDSPINNELLNSDVKYHYLLVDVSTSVSNNNIHSERIIATKPDSAIESTPDDSYQRLLLEEAYQVDNTPQYQNETEKVPDSLVEPKKEDRSNLELISDFLEPEHTPTPEPLPVNVESLSDHNFEEDEDFMYEEELAPTITEIPKDDEFEVHHPPDPSPELLKQRPSILKDSINFAFPRHPPESEGPKVRYSLLQSDLPNLQHLAIMSKLDQLPPVQKEKSENIPSTNDKMREFRTIDQDDVSNRRFQISNADKFEIRRVSTVETKEHEDDERTTEKAKSTCCGIGQHSKSKKRGGSFSSDHLR